MRNEEFKHPAHDTQTFGPQSGVAMPGEGRPEHPLQGLSLREYYAGIALRECMRQGILPYEAAKLSVQYADELITKLETERFPR